MSAVLRDRPFVLLLLSTLLRLHRLLRVRGGAAGDCGRRLRARARDVGLLIVINPLLVILGQLRLTRASARVPAGPRLSAATLLLGLPFLALLGSSNVAVIAAVIVAFVVGEMIWMPTSQTIAAQLAPPPARGTYFGALAAANGPAWTLAPYIAFKLQAHTGVGSVWIFFAAVAVVAATAGLAAVRGAAAAASRSHPQGLA